MDKEKILQMSKKEKDEGYIFALNKGYRYGAFAAIVISLIIAFFNKLYGVDNDQVEAIYFACFSAIMFGEYTFSKKKANLVISIILAIDAILNLYNYLSLLILGV